jgi:type II secretory pathway component PulJ
MSLLQKQSKKAYTLLEVTLALALTAVILGLIGMAIHVHLGVADKSRVQVDEAQLARTLLQRIAEDLRNAVPFTPEQSSTSGAPTSSGSSTSSESPTSSTSQTTSETPISGGICGSLQCLQVDTSCRSRPSRLPSAPATGDNSQPAFSDIKTVTYSLGDPGTISPIERGDSLLDAQGGLYRRELERAECAWAMQQGQTDLLNQVTDLLAPEVVDVQFTYYDGTTTSDVWDSTQQGKLPSAVKVAIVIRRPAAQPSSAALQAAADSRPPIIYDMLVDLPNSQVNASQTASQSGSGSSGGAGDASTQPSSTQPPSTQPTGTTPLDQTTRKKP